MDEANELLWVKAGPRLGKGKIGLSEADASHPGDPLSGAPEVFIYDGGTAVLVAPTPGVLGGLSDGRLALATQAEVTHAKATADALRARAQTFAEATQGYVLTPLPPPPPPAPLPEPPAEPPATTVLEQLAASGQTLVTEKRETTETAPSPTATPVGGGTTASASTTTEAEGGARRRP